MRYAWDQFDAYFGADRLGAATSGAMRSVLRAFARWDADTAPRVDRYIAISEHVADRIRRHYNRAATVVYPPVDTTFFQPDGTEPDPSFLVVSALVPYKRIDLAIEACRLSGAGLRIVGHGPEFDRLTRLAGPKVEFLGSRTDADLRELYRRATAVLLPGEEEFGIAQVEAQACGRPVIALNRGGARETVIDGVTGILVDESTPEAFAEAILRTRRERFDSAAIRGHAERFSRDAFVAGIARIVQEVVDAPGPEARW